MEERKHENSTTRWFNHRNGKEYARGLRSLKSLSSLFCLESSLNSRILFEELMKQIGDLPFKPRFAKSIDKAAAK